MRNRVITIFIVFILLATPIFFLSKTTGVNKFHELTYLKETNEQQRLEIVDLKYELKLAKMYEANRQSLCKR